ncbi:hypothetical protein L484_018146 [Morus notabilis]|uniref:FHA domain-containing protein n=1 Tax=Morus notabilis TaxID=981085 RepID=W9RK47_9ROSA|nr:hypothetical protein L484_018146 [Morus notabilis]
MTTAMGPPPPRTPNPLETPDQTSSSSSSSSSVPSADSTMKTPMGPPPPSKEPSAPDAPPAAQNDVAEGVLQFKRSGEAYVYDLGSTHGTFINKNQSQIGWLFSNPTVSTTYSGGYVISISDQLLLRREEVEKKSYVDLHVGDVIRFGQSSRLYIFQGPTELMPQETDLKKIRDAKIREDMLDREASLQRARHQASLAEGVSWGMGEDAIEEAEDDSDEVTWQTYKGQLTEKQEKTREKVIKRMEKISHMKKEIDAIRTKDISQGGLTQGQQTQIARNEQRIAQIMEELENLEETLNESIRESLGARAGTIGRGRKKGAAEEDDEFLSDDDDFYDRTKKKPSSKKAAEHQSVETADTLLDKRDSIIKEIEDKKEVLLIEKNKMVSEKMDETETGDALDAFMSGISSQLVIDKTTQLQEELSALQSKLDRILYLLKIADPTGEAAKKRVLKVQELKPKKSATLAAASKKQPTKEPKESSEPEEPENGSMKKEKTVDATVKSDKKPEADEIMLEAMEGKTPVYVEAKPQWLGAVENKKIEESQQSVPLDVQDSDDFVDYKDRKKMLVNGDGSQTKVESGLENAAPGLIVRKRKQVHEVESNKKDAREQTTSSAELMAMDAVALLLKHQRGSYASGEDNNIESQETLKQHQPSKDKKPKRVLGPEKPSFLDSTSDSETWVPPEGQSGDGRTSLNDRYGY